MRIADVAAHLVPGAPHQQGGTDQHRLVEQAPADSPATVTLLGQGIQAIEAGAAAHEGTAMQPHQHGQPAAGRDGARSAHIHAEAILLTAGFGELEAGRLGCAPTLGLSGKRNAALFDHAVMHHTPQSPWGVLITAVRPGEIASSASEGAAVAGKTGKARSSTPEKTGRGRENSMATTQQHAENTYKMRGTKTVPETNRNQARGSVPGAKTDCNKSDRSAKSGKLIKAAKPRPRRH